MSLRTSLAVQPHLYIGDVTGKPLDYGIVFFGQPNKDPEFYPINIFYDEALTIPAAHPVRTKGGFMNANGQMVEVYALETEYSVKVLDTYGRQVFYQPVMSGENAELVAQKLDTGITATAKFGGSARLLSDKLSEIVSVKDFGAVGDGTVDDTAAIQKAIDSGVKNLYFPTGVYGINNNSLSTLGNIHLHGDGKHQTILKQIVPAAASTNPILKEVFSNSVLQGIDNLIVSDLSFEGNGSAANKVDGATSGLFRCYKSKNLLFQNVDFYNSRGYGVGLQGTPASTDPQKRGPHIDTNFIGCNFYNNGKAEYFNVASDPMDGIDIKACDIATFINCKAWGNGDKGFDVRSNRVIFNACMSWGNATHGFEMGAVIRADITDSFSALLSDCIAHDNLGSGVYIYGSPFTTLRNKINISNIQAYNNRHGISNPSSSGGNDASHLDVTVVGGSISHNTLTGIEILGSQARYIISDLLLYKNSTGLSAPASQIKTSKISNSFFEENGTSFNVSGNFHFNSCHEILNDVAGTTKNKNRFANHVGQKDESIIAKPIIRLPESANTVYIGGSTNIGAIESSWDGRVVYLRVSAGVTILATVGVMNGNFVPTASETSMLALIYRASGGWTELSRI